MSSLSKISLKFHSIDFWGRPIYKVQELNVYICSVDIIFPNKDIAPTNSIKEINKFFRKNLDKLVIFGSSIDGDPLGTPIKKNLKIIIKNEKHIRNIIQ